MAKRPAIRCPLEQLEPDETLLVQSGKPVAVFRTHEDAQRVLIANSNIVPHWITQENFDRWEQQGLIIRCHRQPGGGHDLGEEAKAKGEARCIGLLGSR